MMIKHFVSVLLGLASLATLYTGFTMQANQNDIIPVVIEENIETNETSDSDFNDIAKEVEATIDNEKAAENNQNIEETIHTKETTVNEAVEETNPPTIEKNTEEMPTKTTSSKIDKVVSAGSNEEIKRLYKELNNCDENTVYRKVIVNGKEYNNCNSKVILDDLINKYGFNLNELNKNLVPRETQEAAKAPEVAKPTAQTQAAETEHTPPAQTQAPTQPVQTQAAETNPQVTAPAETSSPQPSNSNYANEVLRLVNVERAKAGKSALTMDSKLNQAAYRRSVEIVSVFSHTRPDGSSAFTVLDEFGINAQAAGENIAWGQRSPSEVVNGWMNSDGHRANILSDKFGKLGVGVHEENGRLYWTQLFTN